MDWAPGDVVAWRERWRGQAYMAIPVRVVRDIENTLAVYVSEGTRYSFPEPWPFGERHPWAVSGAWKGFTEDDVAAIRSEGERVLAEWPFSTGWEEWEVDPTWPVPELPHA